MSTLPRSSNIRAVLLDLDNTLTVSEDFAAEVLSAAALQHGFRLEPAVILEHPGAVYVPLLQELTGVNELQALEIYKTYVELYEWMMPGRLQPIPGAEQLLTTLAARGVPLALITNKSQALATAVLELFGWRSHFALVVGNDSSPYTKPHPGPALIALTHLECLPVEAAFVGDTAGDMECGSAAGIPMLVAVLGTTRAADLEAAGATHVCHDLDEVLHVLTADDPGLRRDASAAS